MISYSSAIYLKNCQNLKILQFYKIPKLLGYKKYQSTYKPYNGIDPDI